MQFVRKSREIETLVSISIQQKVLQLLQVRLRSFWLELVTNSLRASLVRSTEEVGLLRVGSSQSVEWLMRTTEGLLESVCSTLQILLTRSRSETVSLSMRSIKLKTASERRLMSSQRLTDEMQATDRVGDSQFYLFFYYTMDKLLQLLNEYQTQRESKFKFSGYDERSLSFLLIDSNEVLWEETIISKKFWFIERLIANDKLNKEWLFNIIRESCIFNDMNICSESDYIIMYLAIGYNPIYFLTSMVK